MKKILIKAPKTKEEILSSYLIVHHLYNDLPEVEVCIIVDESLEKYYQYIPFNVKIYAVNELKMSLPAIHKFAYNLNDVFNIDYFFDLQSTKESAFYGTAFRAKERYGFDEGFMRGLFLNNLVTRKEGASVDYQYLDLLKASGLIASDMATFSGHDDDLGDLEKVFHTIILLFEEFSFEEGQIIKLLKDNFENSEICVFSENHDVEFKGIRPVHDVDELLKLLQKPSLCVSNTPYYYGLLKYMKDKFISFGDYRGTSPFYDGQSLKLSITDNGKIENLSSHDEDLLDTDCIKEISRSFFELNS